MRIDTVKLKEMREDQALSMRELAKRAGVDLTTVYRIEHGQVNVQPRTLRRVAGALGVEPRELRGDALTKP